MRKVLAYAEPIMLVYSTFSSKKNWSNISVHSPFYLFISVRLKALILDHNLILTKKKNKKETKQKQNKTKQNKTKTNKKTILTPCKKLQKSGTMRA